MLEREIDPAGLYFKQRSRTLSKDAFIFSHTSFMRIFYTNSAEKLMNPIRMRSNLINETCNQSCLCSCLTISFF